MAKNSPNLSLEKQLFSFLPVYSSEAGGEFGSGGFMMCEAGAAMPVPRAVFRTWAIYIIMRTGHILDFVLPASIINIEQNSKFLMFSLVESELKFYQMLRDKQQCYSFTILTKSRYLRVK